MTDTRTVMWFRRDLRLGDNPALLDACASDGVLPLFVLDPALWRPAGAPRRTWLTADGVDVPDVPPPAGRSLPEAGEDAARRRWAAYLDEHLHAYADERDRPDLDSTSQMSVHLKWGEIHPRTMLADLAEVADTRGAGATAYRKELAWRAVRRVARGPDRVPDRRRRPGVEPARLAAARVPRARRGPRGGAADRARPVRVDQEMSR
jgi:deoxyribodipyrimidine photolyase